MTSILDVDNVSFGYTKDSLLFENFSISLKKGEVKAIVGASGAGKSTLFELILKNLKPFSGKITAAECAQVFQDPYSSFHPSYTLLNQIKDVADSFVTSDDLEVGIGNKVALWMFGFLY